MAQLSNVYPLINLLAQQGRDGGRATQAVLVGLIYQRLTIAQREQQ
jgi:hypothetical protein